MTSYPRNPCETSTAAEPYPKNPFETSTAEPSADSERWGWIELATTSDGPTFLARRWALADGVPEVIQYDRELYVPDGESIRRVPGPLPGGLAPVYRYRRVNYLMIL